MILITGATGFIGRQLVARLQEQHKPIRLLLPEALVGDAQWTDSTEIMVGTLADAEAVYQATSGVNTIIHLESAQWWGGERDLQRIEVTGTRNLVEAARTARVGRIMVLSHLGATPASAYPLIRIKGVVEGIVRSSGLAYTIIRSGLVFGEHDAFYNHIALLLRAQPIFIMPGRGEVVLHPIYIDDLVGLIVASLDNLDTVDQVIEVGGPEYISLRDLIQTIMRVTGQYRTVIPVPPYVLRWLSTLSALFARRTLITSQWFDLLATNRVAPLNAVPQYYKERMHRLEDTLLTYMPEQNSLVKALQYRLRPSPQRQRSR